MDCTITALATALEKPVDEIIALIGHDGKEVVHPHLPPPLCFRGFHIQELTDCCLSLGKALVLIEKESVSTPNGVDVFKLPFGNQRFASHLICSRGILFGRLPNGVGHAVAWDSPFILERDQRILLPQYPMQIMFFAKILSAALDIG